MCDALENLMEGILLVNQNRIFVYFNFILNRASCAVGASSVCRVEILVAGNQAHFWGIVRLTKAC